MALAAVVIGAQASLTTAFTWTFASGQSPASTWGAIPTTQYEAALAAVARAASTGHARQVYLAGDPGDPFMGLYWAQRENNLEPGAATTASAPLWTAYPGDACALTPPAGVPAAPMLAMYPGLAARTLAGAPGARTLATLAPARGASWPLVAVPPNAAGLAGAGLGVVNGELRLDRAFLLPASGGLPARAVTLWTALRSTPPGPAVAIYHIHFLFATPSGLASVFATCAPSAWVAGEGVVIVAALPAGARTDTAPALVVSRETHSWWRPRIFGVTLETAKELYLDPVVLPRATVYGPGVANPSQAQLDGATLTPPLARGW